MAQLQTVTSSRQFSLNMRDVLKGLLIAVLTPVMAVIVSSLEAGSLTFDWKRIGIVALSAFAAYIVKNFLDPAKVVITNPSDQQVKEVEAGRKEAVIVPK